MTPLPPDAKEFCNMPKSPCASCGVMVPLQAVPSHIESCKDSIDLCSSSEVVQYAKSLTCQDWCIINCNEYRLLKNVVFSHT